jgi:Ca2+-binding RTX toxin-like protein
MSLKGGGWAYVTSEEAFFFDNDGLASAPRDVEAFSASTFWDRSTDFAWLNSGGWVGYGYLESSGELGQNAYDHDGGLIVSEGQVNSTEEGYQSRPRYIGTRDGGWVVVWRSEYMAPEGPKYQVFTQAFNADGAKRGDEVVAGTADGGLTGPFITELKDGTFITVWSERDATSGVSSVHQLHLDASGLPVGTETLVSSSRVPYDAEPRATALHGGGWVVTWKGVSQQVFDENGNAIGTTSLAVEGANTGHEVVALDNGGWVALHWSYGDIIQQIYSASGSPIGEAQTVNTYTTYQQMNVDAAALPDGKWVVTWESANQDGSGTGIYQRVFQFNNSAPTAASDTLTVAEDTVHMFEQGDFGFADVDGDELAGITVTAVSVAGSLTLNGVAVTAGQFVQADDLEHLAWFAGDDVNGAGIAAFTFTARDDGGTDHGGEDTSTTSYAINFDVSEVVDRFIGTKKKNELVGTGGRDILDGKGGIDRLLGDRGNDTLIGGNGADRFVFRTGDGRDTAKDFNAVDKAHDILDLSDLESVTSFKDLKRNHIDQAGKHVVIDGLNGDEIVLQNVKIKDLDAGDFVF